MQHEFEPQQPFWLVWNEKANAPTFKHATFESARAEAERLARVYQNCRFHVLQAMGHASVNTVNWTVVQDDFVPF